MKKRTVYFVLSTHWDREWYQTFQDYRYRLVDLVDDVLKGLSTGELKGPFYSDGQSCLLEDYLEVRPERGEEVKARVKSGQIAAGPWYVLPDEFLISGEATIRNIRLGFDIVRRFGAEPSRTGFLCDMFGHISQMPQILKGFGINAAFIWRGLNFDHRDIIWEGADGSRIASHVFGNHGYGDYGIYARQATVKLYEKFDRAVFAECLEKWLKVECEKTDIEPILAFDGLDHQCWDRQAYAAMLEILSADERFDVKHTGLDEYAAAMQAHFDKITAVVKGELRQVTESTSENNWLITGVVSSRVDIKQDNTLCQNLLCHWAEPFAAMANIATGMEYPQGFLNVAWKWLMKNHPHDSICGCSIDQVHKDMEFRFSQARQIGQRLTSEALRSIALAADAQITEDELKVVVFNPLPQAIDEVVELPIQIPTDWPVFQEFFGFEKLPTFRIKDAAGNNVEYQRISQTLNKKNVLTFRLKTPDCFETTQVVVAVKISVPAMGYTALIIEKAKAFEPVRHSNASMIAHSGGCLENECLKVQVNPDGSVNMLDKRTGQTYRNMLTFEDTADIGDGWYYGIAANDEQYSSLAGRAQVSIAANGAEVGRLKIRTTMSVPEEFDFTKMRRSEKLKDLVITSVLTLRAGSDKIEVETSIDNNICDHRIRVVLPSGAANDTYLSDSLFDVVERPVAIAADNYKKKELDTDAKPQQSWLAISDNDRGLAVTSVGLYESCVSDEPQKPIKLTLFRSTRRTVMTGGESGGQLLKPLSFKYDIIPVSGQVDRLRIFAEAQKSANGVQTCQLRKKDIDAAYCGAKLPAVQGFVAIDGAVLSSLTLIEGGCEVRFFNPQSSTATATIELTPKSPAAKFTKAWTTDLDFNKKTDLKIEAGKITIPMTAKEIITVVIG